MTNPLTDAEIAQAIENRTPPTEIPVVTWTARRHFKVGSPDSLRVTYSAGLMTYPEWVLFQHSGPGRYRAEKWWSAHGGLAPVPATVDEALARWGEVRQPVAVLTRKNGSWFDIVGRIHAAPEPTG